MTEEAGVADESQPSVLGQQANHIAVVAIPAGQNVAVPAQRFLALPSNDCLVASRSNLSLAATDN